MPARQVTGFFLGAGATCEVAMPLVWDLTTELKRWLSPDKLRSFNESWIQQGGGHPPTLIEHFGQLLARPELHYEAILGNLETEGRRTGIPRDLQHEYHALYSWLIEMVYYLLYFRHTRNVDRIEKYVAHLEGLLHFAEAESPLWVFTLNHDLIIECLAARFDVPVSCGFGPELVELPRRDASGCKTGTLRAEAISAVDLETQPLPFARTGRGINLLKIHGGLDQFTFRDGKDFLRILPTEKRVRGVIEALRVANEELVYVHNGRQPKATNEIVYADDDGEMQFLRRCLLSGAYKFDTHNDQVLPRRMLEHFRSNLRHVDRLICIGYGFGDSHINIVLRDWLAESAERRLEIVGPGITAVPAPLLHLAPQVGTVNASGTDYLDRCAGIVRTPEEQTNKRLVNWSRGRAKEDVEREFAKFVQEHRERILSDEVIADLEKRLATLPRTPDGDLDTAALGVSIEEHAAIAVAEQRGAIEHALLKAFLDHHDPSSAPES